MADPSIAAVIGRAQAGTPGPEIFHEIAMARGLKCLPERASDAPFNLLAKDLFPRLDNSRHLGAQKAVFLLCVERGHTQIPEVIQKIIERRAHADIVVYADEAHDSGVLAMQCTNPRKGIGAAAYIVRDRSSEASIRELFRKLFSGTPMYPPFRLMQGGRRGSTRKAFIVTPYHDLALTDYYEGIEPALNELKIRPVVAKDELTFSSVLENVQNLIVDSEFVIVNLSEYKGFGPSANCYFELGYALGRRLPVILVHRFASGDVASNIAGVQLVEYSHLAELSMRLYGGLK